MFFAVPRTDTNRQIAAIVGDQSITLAEVDALAGETGQADVAPNQLLTEPRRRALNRLIEDSLFGMAARQAGKPLASWLSSELASRTRDVTEADLEAAYGQHANRGRESFDALRPELLASLQRERDRQARSVLVAELKSTAFRVSILLPTYRVEVAPSADDPADGPSDASVTILVFADYLSSEAARLDQALGRAWLVHSRHIRIVTMDFPDEARNPLAFDAAMASRCAFDQDRGAYFRTSILSQKAPQATRAALKAHALLAGLEPMAFESCLETRKFEGAVRRSIDAARRAGLRSSPVALVNGRPVTPDRADDLREIIEEELAAAALRGRQPA